MSVPASIAPPVASSSLRAIHRRTAATLISALAAPMTLATLALAVAAVSTCVSPLGGSAWAASRTMVARPAAKAPAAPSSAPAAGQPDAAVEKIAAVVNDEIISTTDVDARVDLALLSSGLPDTPDSRGRLVAQVLRGLIDERLQMQEAKKLDIKVSDHEVDEAIGRIADQNKMNRAQLEQLFADRRIPLSTLKAQGRAALLWNKVVIRKLRPSIEIGDDEVDAVVKRIQANAGKSEYLVAEIFLSVDKPDQDEEVHRLADRLAEQISKGANFAAVARQFSQAAGANNGGDLGWIQAGQLPADLDTALQNLQPGQMSRPIHGFTGYTLLYVRDRRTIMAGNPADSKLTLAQIVLPVTADTPEVMQRAKAAEISRTVQGCDAFRAQAKTLGSAQSGDLGVVRAGDLPERLGALGLALPIGKPSEPLVQPSGVVVLMVCDRVLPVNGAPDRAAISEELGGERMDMLQRRYMRDLRQAAYIDQRM
ncbi:MAG: peptidylprolyl isomerase [Azospirillaceae bacterium]|nr:peptidylprolyl isomerase [Azospirillaceae bacterium]